MWSAVNGVCKSVPWCTDHQVRVEDRLLSGRREGFSFALTGVRIDERPCGRDDGIAIEGSHQLHWQAVLRVRGLSLQPEAIAVDGHRPSPTTGPRLDRRQLPLAERTRPPARDHLPAAPGVTDLE